MDKPLIYGPPARVYRACIADFDHPAVMVYSTHTGGAWQLRISHHAVEDAACLVEGGHAVWGPPVDPDELFTVPVTVTGKRLLTEVAA